MTDCIALVVAAGRGMRAGGGVPKQYRALAGSSVLRFSLDAFAAHPRVGAVRAVIHPDDRELYDAAASGLDLLAPVAGGSTRQESVRLGLESLATLAPRHVLIHDGARPFVDAGIIDRTLDALAQAPAAIAAVPLADTLKRGVDGRVGATVDRAGLWRAQTPQGFHFDKILAAHRAAAGAELTDDAAVAERAGLDVALVMGSEANMKLTTDDDLRRAERLVATPAEPHVGTGFDVHRFGPGDHVWLCGLKIAHTHGQRVRHVHLKDVPQWRGKESAHFLAHAAQLAREAGGRIAHVDVTIICERPKVGPHRATMAARVAEILGLPVARCSVKATTTEGLGFTGRAEGLAAQAVATVMLPI